MRRIKFYFFTSFLILALTGCATNAPLTDALSSVANEIKYDDPKLAAILNVGANLSKAAEDITPENEYYIGRSVAATILQTYSVYENPVQEKYVNQIAQSIIKNSDMPEIYNGYHVKILDTDEMNAFATSGGHIFVTKGLLQCAKSEDAIAAALAHEISHIQLKHSSSAIKTSRYTDLMTSVAGAALTMKDQYELANVMDDCVGGVVNQLVSKGYSKEQEFDADEYAIGLMLAAGYNPREMISLLTAMKEVCDKQETNTLAILKTHPEPQKRIKEAQDVLSDMKKMKLPETSAKRQARFEKIMHS